MFFFKKKRIIIICLWRASGFKNIFVFRMSAVKKKMKKNPVRKTHKMTSEKEDHPFRKVRINIIRHNIIIYALEYRVVSFAGRWKCAITSGAGRGGSLSSARPPLTHNRRSWCRYIRAIIIITIIYYTAL